jgi:hypothetical protein
MKKFVIENGILKAYLGRDAIVVVPDGVTHIGGDLLPEDKECPRSLRGDMLGYKAFYNNRHIKELYLPDSVVEIGYKALEHCKSLEVLSFSGNMKTFGCNAIVGCDSLRKVIYRGTIFEFSCLKTPGQTPDLEVVYCMDGEINFGKDRQYYIETLFFPGTRAEWNAQIPPNDWRNKRCRKIVCIDDIELV